MKGRPQFNNFSGGELDPRRHAQTDTPEYRTGVKTAKNMVAHIEGTLESRGGTRFLAIINTEHPTCKFLKHQRGTYEAVCLYNRLSDGANIARTQWFSITGGAQPPVSHIEDSMLLTVNNAAVTLTEDATNGGIDWTTGRVRLFTTYDEGNTATQVVRFTMAALPTLNNAVMTVKFSDIVMSDDNTVVTVLVGETVAAAENTVEEVTVTNTNTCTVQAQFNVAATDIFIEVTLASDLEYEVSIVSINESHHNQGAYVSSFSPDNVKAMRSCVDISTEGVIALHPSMAPYRQVWDATGYTSSGNVSFTSKPAEWIVGNFPTICDFHEGRSWWSGCPNNPRQIWASRVNTAVAGDYFDMTTGALATDAISIIREKPGYITNIVSGSELLVLSDRDSFIISSVEGVITPSDIQEVPQSGTGAAPVDPISLGSIILYVAVDNKRILLSRYIENIAAWRDVQINVSAMHLFNGKTIQRMEYLANEVQQIFVLFSDGTMVMGVVDSAITTFGWSSFTYNLRIGDIVTYYRAGKTYLLLASYGPAATESAALELYEPEFSLDHMQEFFDTSGATYVWTDPFNSYIYTAVNYAVRRIPDVVIAHGSDYWTASQGVVHDGYFAMSGTLPSILHILPDNDWEVDYRPAYCLVTFTHNQATVEFSISTTTTTVYAGNLAPGSHILKLPWTATHGDISAVQINSTAANGGVYCLAFSDDKDALKKVQQFYRVRYDEGAWGYMGHGIYDMYTLYVLGQVVNHFVSGVSIDKEVETLELVMPTQVGSGKATIRGNNRVHVGLLTSEIPDVNGAVPKVDEDATVDDDGTIVDGHVRSTVKGYTRNMKTTITHNKPGKLEVAEVILDITQSEDG